MTNLFEYLLNAFEQASQSPFPSSEGYAAKRRAVLEYVRKLEDELHKPDRALEGAGSKTSRKD